MTRWNLKFLGTTGVWLVFGFPAINAGESSPKPSLEGLVGTYRKFGLPLPPADAKLVLFETGATASHEGKSWRLYSLGFLLKPGKGKQQPVLLVGTQECSPAYPDNEVKIVEPDPKLAGKIDPEYGYLTFFLNTGLATAIQCKSRGWDDLAKALLEVSLKQNAGHPYGIFFQPADQSAKTALAFMAWAHWGNELAKKDSDPVAIAKRMKELMDAEPKLKTKWTEAFLRRLQASIKPSKSKPGSPEAFIDDLTNVSSERSWDARPDDPRLRLLEQGFDAVPVLIEHLDDDRLTRAVDLGFNNFAPRFRVVCEFVSEIIRNIADEDLLQDRPRGALDVLVAKPTAKKWWANAQKKGEKAYLLENVFPKKPGETWPNPYMIFVLGKKYPDDLAKIYETILKDKPQIETVGVADVISKSALPKEKKIELLKKGSSHEKAGIRKVANTYLKSLESKK